MKILDTKSFVEKLKIDEISLSDLDKVNDKKINNVKEVSMNFPENIRFENIDEFIDYLNSCDYLSYRKEESGWGKDTKYSKMVFEYDNGYSIYIDPLNTQEYICEVKTKNGDVAVTNKESRAIISEDSTSDACRTKDWKMRVLPHLRIKARLDFVKKQLNKEKKKPYNDYEVNKLSARLEFLTKAYNEAKK